MITSLSFLIVVGLRSRFLQEIRRVCPGCGW